MAKPESANEVTVRRLSNVVVGVWDKVKANTISDVAWDSTNKKLTKTKNGTTSDVVTSGALQSALAGSIADGNTGFVTGDAAYDALALKANLASPTLTGTPKAPTATAGTNTTQIATTAFVKAAVDAAISSISGDLTYKGTYAGGSTGAYGALTPAADKGDVYKVSTAGKLDGVAVEVGDMLICNSTTAAATSENYATVAAKWDFIQANIDGAVTGPSSSVDNQVAVFNGATGKIIKDSGFTIGKSVPSNAVFTDASVTAVGNHYTPSGGTSKSASGGAASELPTSSTGSLVQVLTGVTVDAAGHVTAVSSKGLWSPNTTYSSQSEAAGGTSESLCTTGEKYTWNHKQDALQTQTAYTSQGGATKVPQITTNNLGQVTGITEVTISGVTPASHTHGSITNDGKIGSTSGYAVYTTTGGALTAGSLSVSSPSASGNTLAFIDTISQDAKGQITATKKNVKISSTYSGTGTDPVNGTAVKAAIDALDATVTSTNGTNVQISVVETNGLLTSASVTTDNTENKNNKVTTWTATTTDTHYPSEKLVKDTIDEQAQVVAASLNDLDDRISDIATATSGAVLYDTAQTLTTEQKTQARSNIGAGTSDLTIGTSSSTAAAGNHAHGNITNAGAITTSAALASGDALVFTDSSDSNKLKKTSITFDGTTATKALTQKGTWETFVPSSRTVNSKALSSNITLSATDVSAVSYANATQGLTDTQKSNARTNIGAGTSNLTIGTTSSTAAAGDHTHSASIATSTGTSSVTLASNSKYELTAGGSSVIFTMPTIPSAANNGALKIGLNGGTATSKFTANQSSDSTLTFATGSANGTIAVDGTDVAVKGLGTAAYTASGAYAGSTHTHGNITNGGALQTTDITIANGDKLVVTDASNSNKVARTSVSFDGTTTSAALSKAGTWVEFQAPLTEMTTTEVDDLLAVLT